MLAASLAGCSSSGGSAATDPETVAASTPAVAAVYTWYTTNPIKGAVAAIMAADDDIVTAIKQSDLTALSVACSELSTRITEFDADPPAPDAIVRQDFGRGLGLALTAAKTCLAGDYATTGTDLVAGDKYIAAATKRITALGP